MSDHSQEIGDVVTFGDVGSPETNKITVPLGGRFQCPCGVVMEHGGHWLAAHFNEPLQRICQGCKQRFESTGEKIKLKGKPYGSKSHGW